jgi:hypothetical protein
MFGLPPPRHTPTLPWVKYGMTAAQAAQVYRVSVTDIERILRKM